MSLSSTLLLDISKRLEVVATEVHAIKQVMEMWTYWAKRVGLLAVLWGAGLIGNLKEDQISSLVAMVVSKLISG